MARTDSLQDQCQVEEEWKDTLRDICEVARNSLHNLVSSGTPPLPRCYQQEFILAADMLQKEDILEMVRTDEDRQAHRYRKVILSARDRMTAARNILSNFEEEAKRNIAHLDHHLGSLNARNARVPYEAIEEIEASAKAIRDSSLGFMENISGVLAQIERQEGLLASLAQKVYEDPLTGALNRRAWERDLKEIVSGHDGTGAAHSPMVSIVIADLDFFKKVNDSYGHPVGDAVLRQFATLLKGHFAGIGSVYRYGGEEFGIILPGISGKDAVEKLEEFRNRLRKALFIAKKGQVKIKVSASYGVAQWTAQQGMAEVISKADRMLYKAKEAGRDCVMFDPL